MSGEAEDRPGVALRILMFEDNPEDVELSLRALKRGGFEVSADVVTTVEDLEQRLRANTYDILLADYRVPRATGLDAFAAVRALEVDIPFVLVTGSLGDEKAVDCLKQGVSDYVLKDRLVRLVPAVRRALEERRLKVERAHAEEALRRSEEQLRQRNQELEEQYRKVEQSSRTKSEFLANMSHELRSPLNGIIGFSELLFDGRLGELTGAQKDCVGRILNGSRHLLRLISDLLDLARIEAGRLTLAPERVAVTRLVAETCESVATIAAEKQIHVEYQLYPEIEAVIDPARLKQVVYNYLSNALKFTPEGGRVIVKVRPEGRSEFRVAVTDTGPGIADAEIGKLFTAFHQLDSGRSKQFQGTGLGLALTRRIVDQQGGRVGVRSSPGVGSTFFAVLPLVTGEPTTNATRTDSDCR